MKFLKWVLIILGVLLIAGYASFSYMKSQTKKASPEATATFIDGDKKLSVFYCRPFKKDREIFGALVPFGEVWRTGANEATTFSTNQDITFGGDQLKAGEYSLWTIPEKNEWTVILNSKMYSWGVSFGGVASRDSTYDVLTVKAPVRYTQNIVEQLTIDFNERGDLMFEWDNVKAFVKIH